MVKIKDKGPIEHPQWVVESIYEDHLKDECCLCGEEVDIMTPKYSMNDRQKNLLHDLKLMGEVPQGSEYVCLEHTFNVQEETNVELGI